MLPLFRAGVTLFLTCLGTGAIGDGFELYWPVACQLGQDCHIQQYVDLDPSQNAHDFRCGPLSYDGHKGTDIRTSTVADMRNGVAVLAAQDGIVKGMRDGMPDVSVDSPGAVDVTGRECGNGVVLAHSDGWETQYCHLRSGTVAVKSGDKVARGDRLGDIGMSGKAAFPHVHFAVRRDGTVIDPFAPLFDAECSNTDLVTLWSDPVPYVATGLLDAGFATEIPDFDAVKDGFPDKSSFSTEAPAIVVWAYYFGPEVGDRLNLSISGPSGFTVNYSYEVERTQAQAMRAAGRSKPADGWAAGRYKANLSFVRAGELRWRTEFVMTVEP